MIIIMRFIIIELTFQSLAVSLRTARFNISSNWALLANIIKRNGFRLYFEGMLSGWEPPSSLILRFLRSPLYALGIVTGQCKSGLSRKEVSVCKIAISVGLGPGMSRHYIFFNFMATPEEVIEKNSRNGNFFSPRKFGPSVTTPTPIPSVE